MPKFLIVMCIYGIFTQIFIYHRIFFAQWKLWNVVKYFFYHVGSYEKRVSIILLDNLKIDRMYLAW